MISAVERGAKYFSSIQNFPRGTGRIAFTNLKELLLPRVSGKQALDFGCGAGRSSAILKALGFDVLGVDIDLNSVKLAKESDPLGSYINTEDFFKDHQKDKFDFIFLSFVLMELKGKEQISDLLNSLIPFMHSKTLVCVICTSEYFYQGTWVNCDVQHDENRNLKSGDLAKVHLPQYDAIIHDYFWRDKDYKECFAVSGLNLELESRPLADMQSDPLNWKDEITKAPFVQYLLRPHATI